MFRLTTVAGLLALLLAQIHADDQDDAVKKELAKFQGEWKLVNNDEIILKFKGNEYEYVANGMTEKGKMKFNPTKKPAQVDVEIAEGDDAGKKQLGIYEWKDEKFKVFFAKAGDGTRPESFEKKDDDQILFEFEKVKK